VTSWLLACFGWRVCSSSFLHRTTLDLYFLGVLSSAVSQPWTKQMLSSFSPFFQQHKLCCPIVKKVKVEKKNQLDLSLSLSFS
jgi:hypothetical protein